MFTKIFNYSRIIVIPKMSHVKSRQSKRTTSDLKVKDEDQINIKPEKTDVGDNNNKRVLRSRGKRPHLTVQDEDEDDLKLEQKFGQKKGKKSEEQMKDGVAKWSPVNWKQAYDNIKKFVKGIDDPYNEEDWYFGPMDNPEARFHVLVAVMLSSQTRDIHTTKVVKRLRESGLSIDYILNKDEHELADELKPVNYYRNKAKYLKKTAAILKEQYGGDIPNSVEKLLALPGVGPKVAIIVMHEAWNKNEGLAVDTHVHRISNLMAWVPQPTKTPEDTRKELESWVPRDLWHEFNLNVVAFGQKLCLPRFPKCDQCPNNKSCPSAFSQQEIKAKTRKPLQE